MDFYTFLKFLHVALAIAWLGGTFSSGIFGLWAWRRGTVADMASVIRQSTFLAGVVFGPATLGVLAIGLYMAWVSFGLAEAWIDFALAALAVHLVVGYGVVLPRLKALQEAMEGGGLTENDRAAFGWLMRMNSAHDVMLFSVVLAMVAKPAWSDTGLIAAILIIAVLGFAQVAIPISAKRAP